MKSIPWRPNTEAKRILPKRLQVLLFVTTLAVLLSIWMLIGLETVPPHQEDESDWILYSRYFFILFIEHDISAATWVPRAPSWLRISPPIPFYTIGLAWWLAGYDVSQLNQLRYDTTKTYTQNQMEGRAPPDSILIAVRRFMALMTVATMLILFYLAVELGGWVGAGATTWMMATSVMTLVNGRRAMSDEPLMFFSLLSLLFMYLAAKYCPVNKLTKPTLVLLGLSALALGLAMGSKVNALFVAVALSFGWIAVNMLEPPSPTEASNTSRGFVRPIMWRSFFAIALCAGIAVITFISINPSLYTESVPRAFNLILSPTKIIPNAATNPSMGPLLNLSDRWFKSMRNMLWGWYFPFTWQSFVGGGYNWLALAYQCQPWASSSACSWTFWGLAFNTLLFVTGMVIFLKRAIFDRHASYYRPEILILLVWAITIIGATSSLIPYAWDRYFYPLSPPAYLVEGLGVSAILAWGLKAADSLFRALAPGHAMRSLGFHLGASNRW